MNTFSRCRLAVAACLGLLLVPAVAVPQGMTQPPALIAGQTATLLPDGRWLLLGGQALQGPLGTAALYDPQTGLAAPLRMGLGRPRAWHTATVLPDGRVFVMGGLDGAGRVVEQIETFRLGDQAFQTIVGTGLSPRAYHTATLLTDGQLLIAGGVSVTGQPLAASELWSSQNQAAAVGSQLVTPREGATATLLPDGTVLIWGGRARDGAQLQGGEIFDPDRGTFTAVGSIPPTARLFALPPEIAAAIPAGGSADVPVDSLITLRFSKPLRVDTVNGTTVTLTGPQGPELLEVVAAEGGRLVFVTPQSMLQPGATYTLAMNGVADSGGMLLPFTTIPFTTTAPTPLTEAHPGRPGVQSAGTASPPQPAPAEVASEDGPWRGPLRDGKPFSRWQAVPPLQARPGVTALAGQVLRLDGEPLANVTLQIAARTARTDARGRFLLEGIPAGHQELLIDGRSASRPGRTYGVFEVGVDLEAGRTTVLPFTSWMPRIDTAHAVTISSPTTQEVVITTPRIPGLELHLPAGTVIRDHEGHVAQQVSLTPIPLDRPPFPLPRNVVVPLYFTAQPGAGYVYNTAGAKASIVYPNRTKQPPGARFNFWDYDPGEVGWHVYGLGTVTADGRQIVPDPGVGIYEFTGAMINDGQAPPSTWPIVGGLFGADPVDLGTGLFVLDKPDLVIQDVLPLALRRVYRPGDSNVRAFGIGTTHLYGMFLWSAQQYQQADLILPDGGRVHYVRISSGTGFTDAVFEHTATPTGFYKSQIAWNGHGWNLTLTDGTVYVFGENAPLQAIRDRYGNQVTLTRTNGQFGNITRVTSPNGRALQFSYDPFNRITQVQDDLGRVVSYTYASGRLASVTDPSGGVTQYTYDASHRMLTITDARGITFLTNTYDANGRVTQQTQADATTFQLAYTLDSNGKVTQTDVTDPRGKVRRLTFNGDGYALSDTWAQGAPEQQATSYVRQTGTNLLQSKTDALSRQTAYTYDTKGNVTSVTRLAGSAQAVTTTLTYEPTFNQVASITDALNHTTNFSYDTAGHLTTITDPLGKQTTFTYNAQGQPVTVTDPLTHTSQLSYDVGDLVTVTDPLGKTTTRFTDAVGRVLSVTSARGNQTRFDYDPLNALTRVTDALGGQTAFSYDRNGNLLSVTDARGKVTSYSPNAMDRVQTRTDPLLHSASYQYDPNGNLQQVTDRKSQVTTLTYDVLNRLTGASYADGSTTSWTWDAADRLTQVIDSISGTITRTLDGLDRLMQEVTPQGTVSYTYDAADRRTSMTVLGQPSLTYGYDNADRLTSLTQGSATVTIAYDDAGRRTSLTLPNGVATAYGYDDKDQLTNLTFTQGATTLGTLSYSYDADGNRTVLGGTWARTGIPQPVTSASYNDANQQLTWGTQTLSYDLNGNLTGDGVNTYTWDARDRLVTISGDATASFQYDPFGRRTRKVITGTTTDFLYDGVNPIQELSGGTVLANILAGLGVDEYFTRTDAGGTRTLLGDALGSILALTDSGGTVQTQYTYEPFGTTAVSGATSANTFEYTGRENDGTGLYYYRARYYSPKWLRFLSEDPLEFNGGDLNLYAYVLNAPTNNTDPSGEIPAWLAAAAAMCLRGALRNSLPDLLAGRKPDLGDAALGCLTGGLGGFGKALGRAPGVPSLAKPGAGWPKPLGSPGGPKKGSSDPTKAGKDFNKGTKEAAKAEAGGKCVFCGVNTTNAPGPDRGNTDHAVPKSRGGDNSLGNAQHTCASCNLGKGSMTTQEYLNKLGYGL